MGVREFSKEYNQKAEKKGGVREFSREYNKQRQADTNYTPYIGTAQEYTAAKQRNTLSPEARAAGGFSADATPSLHVSPQNELHAAGNRAKREIYSGVKDAVRVTRPIDTAKGLASGTNNGGEAKAYKSVPGGFDAEEYKAARRMMTYDFDAELDSLEEKRKQLEQKRQSQGYMNPSRYELLGEIEALDKQISALKTERNTAQIYRKMQEYYALQNKSDFASVSASEQYKDTNLYQSVFGSMGDLSPDMLNRAHREEYDRIVDTYGAASEEAKQYLLTYIDNGVRVTAENVHTLTDEEKRIFNYILNTDGEDAASEYLTFMQDTMNQRAALENYARLEEIQNGSVGAFTWLNRHASPVIHSAYTGGETAERGLASVFSNDASSSKSEYLNSMLRENSGSFQRFAMDAAQAVGNMVPSAAVGVINPAAGRVVLGLTAGGNAKREALRMGYTQEQATAYGVLVGVSEATLEKLLGGIQSLSGGKNVHPKIENVLFKLGLKNQTAARALHTYLGNMADEFAEEYLQEILEPVFRNICLDENNEFKLFSEDALYSGLLGAINAAVLNIPYIPDMRAAAREASYQNIYDHILGPLDNGQGKTNASQSTRQRGLSDVSEITSQDVADTLTQSGLDVETAEKIAPDLQSAIIRASEKAAANTDANIRPVSVNAQTGSDGAQDAVYEKLRRVAEEMYDGANDAVSPEISTQETVSAPMRMDSETTSTMQSERLFHDTNTPVRTEEIRARDIQEVARFAAGLGNAGRDVFVSMYDPDMDSAAYLEAMTVYYNAGKNGGALSDVQAQYGNILSQPAREAAHFAGQVDAKALANAAKNGYTGNTDTKTEEFENGRRNQSSDRDGGRSNSLDSVQSGRSVQTGTSAVESGQTSQRQRAESIRTAVHAQRPVSTGSQGLATGTLAKTLRIVPSSMWTDDMRAAVREQSKRGRRVIYFTGELEFRNGNGGSFQARGALARDGKRIWVKADHNTLTVEQIIRHEEYHALVKRDPKLRERTQYSIVKEHDEAELKALAQAYVDLYGWTNADMNDVFEEIMADAYAGIDVFDGLGNLKSAVEYGDAVRREAEKSEATYDADSDIKTSRERMNTDDDGGRTQQVDAESTGRIFQTEEYARGTESAGRTGRKNEKVSIEASERRSAGLTLTFDQPPKMEWAIENTVDSEPGGFLAHEQQKAIEYGVPSFVVSDEAFDHYRGNKRDYPAFAYKGQIYFREHISQEWQDLAIAEHEATHVMRQLEYAPYMDFLQRTPDMIIFNSDAVYKLAERISTHTGVDIFNATPKQLEKFYDEINAGMYGHIAKGQVEELRAVYGDAFKDFDAYVRELTDIHERFKRENGKKVKTSREATRRDIARTLSKMTPAQIALLTREDANTTPYLPRRADSGIDERTGKKSKFADSVAKSKNVSGVTKLLINDVSDIRYYYGISNLDTLDAANERLNAGGAEETIEWYNIKPGHATAEDVALGFILLKRYQDAGMYNGAVNVIRHLRKIGTEAGQTVQAFSILGRLTPEGMAVYAQKELDKAFAEMIDKRGEAWAEKHKDMFQLTAEEIEDIRAKVIAASKLPDGRDKNVLLAQIAQTVEAKLPTNILRQIKAFTRISMLLNSKTMMRNVIVHPIMMPVNAVQDFIGAGIDRALSKQSGVRTTGILKPSISAMKKGVFESYDDFRKHINTREIQNDRFEIGNGADFHYYTKADIASAKWPRKATMALSDVLNTLDRVTNFLLDAGDRPFYEMYFINSLNNQMKLNHASEPTADMIDIATTEALKRTWQDDNAFTRGMANLRKTLNIIGSDLLNLGNAEFGLGNFVLAFVKTPANLIRATVEYSPAGFINVLKTRAIVYARSVKSKQFDPQTQKALVDALSKAITGTLVMIIGGFLARVGWITGSDDDKDEDLAAFERNIMGIAPYSVQINGKSYTYDFAQPISTSLAIGADIALNYNEDDALSKTILNAIGTAGNTIFEQSLLKGLQDLFGMSGVVPSLINVTTGSATQFVPTSLGQIAQMADPYARTSYEYKDILQTTGNQIKAKLPGARNTLASVVDVLGHDVLSNGGENKAFNVFLNPSNVYTKTATQAAEEIYRVYGETGDVTVIPRKAPYYFDYKEKRYTFTSFERADYQRTAGQSNEKIVHDLLNLKGYTELDDDTKAKVLNLTVEYANALAKHTYLKEQKIDFERDSWMEKAENGSDFGVSVAEFILSKAAISNINEGYTDSETGETIENSESLRKMEAIYAIPGLNNEKRAYLFEAFGVGKKVKHYDKNCVAEQLEEIREEAGIK